MPQARDTGAIAPRPQAPKPDKDTMARFMAPSYETDESWSTRTPTNRALRAMDGAIPRLGGLAEICFGLSYREMMDGTRRPDEALRSPYFYLGTALADIAKSLKAAHELWWTAQEAEDNSPRKRAAKPAKPAKPANPAAKVNGRAPA